MASPAITLIRRSIYLSIYLSIFGAHKIVPCLRFPARNGTKRERPLADAVIRDSNLFKFAFRIVNLFKFAFRIVAGFRGSSDLSMVWSSAVWPLSVGCEHDAESVVLEVFEAVG